METSKDINLFENVSRGCKEKNILCNHESWFPRIFFPFATKTEGCKEANFTGFSHENGILATIVKKVSQKM